MSSVRPLTYGSAIVDPLVLYMVLATPINEHLKFTEQFFICTAVFSITGDTKLLKVYCCQLVITVLMSSKYHKKLPQFMDFDKMGGTLTVML